MESYKKKPKPICHYNKVKDNVKYTTLKDSVVKKKQSNIDEYKSLNSQNGLNCVRAYRYPELTYDYKKESDSRLIKANPIKRVFRQYLSKHKSELCYYNEIPIQVTNQCAYKQQRK